MLLIATDEAGYGPKLGPLVIAATTWQVPDCDDDQLAGLFEPMQKPCRLGNAKVIVNDSKAVFKPKSVQNSQQSQADPLETLHATVSVANHWCGIYPTELSSWLQQIAADDFDGVKQTPWLTNIQDVAFRDDDAVDEIVNTWQHSGIKLLGSHLRIIPAQQFNKAIANGMNKADLLSESTLSLVRQAIEKQKDESSVKAQVFCDRHGGRRYYAGVLQHCLEDANAQVIAETKSQSSYSLRGDRIDATIRFTVKGDRFAPVALSSIYAKYVRERMMESFNEYFANLHKGKNPLKPTAGYPTDAIRYLKDIAPIRKRERIKDTDLIRQR